MANIRGVRSEVHFGPDTYRLKAKQLGKTWLSCVLSSFCDEVLELVLPCSFRRYVAGLFTVLSLVS